MIKFHSFSIEENEWLYGPGKRLVLWTQGCSIRCPGCTNPHLWDTDGAKELPSDDLLRYCSSLQGIDGITLLGGEPTDQMEALAEVLEAIKKLGWSVILFTGKEIEEFRSEREASFIRLCDLVICGPFVKSLLNRYLHFRGSSNQRIVKMTDRFLNLEIQDGKNVVSLKIQSDSSVVNLGFPDPELTQMILEHAKRKDDGYDGS